MENINPKIKKPFLVLIGIIHVLIGVKILFDLADLFKNVGEGTIVISMVMKIFLLALLLILLGIGILKKQKALFALVFYFYPLVIFQKIAIFMSYVGSQKINFSELELQTFYYDISIRTFVNLCFLFVIFVCLIQKSNLMHFRITNREAVVNCLVGVTFGFFFVVL